MTVISLAKRQKVQFALEVTHREGPLISFHCVILSGQAFKPTFVESIKLILAGILEYGSVTEIYVTFLEHDCPMSTITPGTVPRP